MTTKYVLRDPVVAMRYQHGSNEHEVYALVNRAGGASFDILHGHLHCFNISGQVAELHVFDGQWVFAISTRLVVLDDVEFVELFKPGD